MPSLTRTAAVIAIAFVIDLVAIGIPFFWQSMRSEPTVAKTVPVVIKRTTSHYSVRGATAADIIADLGRKGPSGHWAYTSYWIEPVYTAEIGDDGRCHARDLEIRYSVKFKMPELGYLNGAPDCLKTAFAAMASNLLAHEQGHDAMGVAAAEKIAKEIGPYPVAETCAALDAGVRSTTMGIISDTNRKQGAYDRDTDHGVKTGVVLEECSNEDHKV